MRLACWLARPFAVLVMVLGVANAISAQMSDAEAGKPTIEEAKAFLDRAEAQLFELGIKQQRTGWVQENFITYDTEMIAAEANEQLTAASVALSKQAHRFDGL